MNMNIKKILILSLLCLRVGLLAAANGALSIENRSQPAGEWIPSEWRFLRHYDQQHLYRIALPLGGIGTGTVSLNGRGELCDWEIMNIPGIGYSTVTTGNSAPFFALYVKPEGGAATTTLLAGPMEPWEYVHAEGRPVNSFGMPRFKHASFDGAYPYGQVNLDDPDIPVSVRIKGFNPIVPADVEASSLPVAVLTYEVTNLSDVPQDVAVSGNLRNFIGKDGSKYRIDWKGDVIPLGANKNRNEFRSSEGLSGLYLYSEGVPLDDPAWGTIALTTASREGVTWRLSSVRDKWNKAILDLWDDFSDDGAFSPMPDSGEDDPFASLSVKGRIDPHETKCFTFYLTWDFPNRKAWSETVVGNYYSTLYGDAWDAAEQIVPKIPELEKRTLQFVDALLDSSFPDDVKEAALFNLSALRSQTVFRLPDGHLMGWEGIMPHEGSCYGSCTHVWNYETATAFLFGPLAMTMRDVEFNYATRSDGLMNFRARLPLDQAARDSKPAADGQLGTVMKCYREWQLSGDEAFLKRFWPRVKLVLSYAWQSGSWDEDADGIMEGAQPNTMDVSYYGPNPQMQFWYMGALKAAEQMALALKDKAFAKQCRTVYERAARFTGEKLFNGEYYEQIIYDPQTRRPLDMDDPAVQIPDFQLGRGCLVDQLVGQYMAHVCDLGYLCDEQDVRTTLRSIMKYNFLDDFSRHFNNMRSYVFAEESGLLMASWPKGRLKFPFPYFSESMTGFEYTAAVGMMYEGDVENGLKCISAVRSRYDGLKRNPYDEIECGHYYARSMASWSAVLALSGFHWSAVSNTLKITGRPGKYFFSTGYAWGTVEVFPDSRAEIHVIEGELPVRQLYVGGKKAPVDL